MVTPTTTIIATSKPANRPRVLPGQTAIRLSSEQTPRHLLVTIRTVSRQGIYQGANMKTMRNRLPGYLNHRTLYGNLRFRYDSDHSRAWTSNGLIQARAQWPGTRLCQSLVAAFLGGTELRSVVKKQCIDSYI